MNAYGLIAGLGSLLVIGLGFPLVIHGERLFGYVCWPYMMGLGILVMAASLAVSSGWASVALGVAGATLVWGSTELKEQAVRAELGWFPFRQRKIKVPFAD